MTGINFKTMLLILLVCVLTGMVLALSSPDVLSAGFSALLPDGSAVAEPSGSAPVKLAKARTENFLRTLPQASSASAASFTASPREQIFSDVETAYVSPEKDHWNYTSPTLYVDIKKVTVKKPEPLVYFVADIQTTDPTLLLARYACDDASGKTRLLPEEIARAGKAVVAVPTDSFTTGKSWKGIVIRCGELKYDRGKADTLAVLPDGSFRIYGPRKIAPADLITMGVRNAFSYGPTLIKDGAFNANLAKHRLAAKNARTGMGIVKPGHYVLIVVDGVDKNYSAGVSLKEFAALFKKYRCAQAYNLEGGIASALCFMGERLNGNPKEKGGSRQKVTDILAIGESDLVPVK